MSMVKYLIEKQNYSKDKLLDLGVEDCLLKKALKELSLKDKLKFYIRKSVG